MWGKDRDNGYEFILRGKGFLGADGDTTKAITDLEETVVDQRGASR